MPLQAANISGILQCIWATSREKVPSNKHKMHRFRSSCACTKYHPGLCSPFIHSEVSNDSVSGTGKALIRLCECAGRSGPSLSAYDERHIFAWHGPYNV